MGTTGDGKSAVATPDRKTERRRICLHQLAQYHLTTAALLPRSFLRYPATLFLAMPPHPWLCYYGCCRFTLLSDSEKSR